MATPISIRCSLPPLARPARGRDAALGTFLFGFALAGGFAAGGLYGSGVGADLGVVAGAALALVASLEACLIALAVGFGMRRRALDLVGSMGRFALVSRLVPRK